MKKYSMIFTLLTAALGAIGAVLHKMELSTVIDPETGLAEPFATVTICVAAVSVLAALLFFLLSVLLRGKSVETVYSKAFSTKTPIPLLISIILLAVMAYGAYSCAVDGVGVRTNRIAVLVLSAFAVMAGISYLVLCISALRRKNSGADALCSFVIVLFVCYWLVISYKEKAADPAMINYIYDFLALCSGALAAYYLAGYSFGRGKPRSAVFFSSLSAYFCIMSIPTASCTAFRMFYIYTALYMLVSMFLLIGNLSDASGEKVPVQEFRKPGDAEPDASANLGNILNSDNGQADGK